MDNNFKKPERRKHKRFKVSLPVKVSGENFYLMSETKDVSISGLYCLVDRFIPVMTKLLLSLFIPLIIDKKKEKKQINCSAVVVRVQPEKEDRTINKYHIGLFFTDITDEDRSLITQYLKQAFFASNN